MSFLSLQSQGSGFKVVRMDYTKQTEWDAQNTVQVKLKLNKRTDLDIIEWISAQSNKQGKIKELIRKEIGESK